MSEVQMLDRAVRSDLKKSDYSRNIFCHQLPPGVDWTAGLHGAYWGDIAGRLTAGDRIEVYTADYSVMYEILILEAIAIAAFVRLSARPLHPHGLVLPVIAASVERPRYSVRPSSTGDGLFDLVDTAQNNLVVKSRLYRTACDAEAQARNEAHRLALGGDTPAPPPPAPPAPPPPADAEALAALGGE